MSTISPLFSIIIPVYNVEQYLDECIQSILCQSYQDYELILVDDGSPDNCPFICDKYRRQNGNIKVIHQKNAGLSSARNSGLDAANGEYVVFLDSDDWWCDRDALLRISKKIEKTCVDVLIIRSKKFYTIDNRYSETRNTNEKFPNDTIISIETAMRYSLFVACAWDKIVKRSVLINNNIRFVKDQLSEDIEWCCKLLLLDLTYTNIEGVIHVYRQQISNSITSNISNRNLKDIYNVIKKYSKLAIAANREYLNHFLALELVLWCAISNKAMGQEGKQIVKDMGNFFYLINYNLYPRVKLVSKIRFMGYNIVRKVLVAYLNR